MSVFGLATCLLNRHNPDRNDVKWNGHDYIGECRHCGSPIIRISRRRWRKRALKEEVSDGTAG